MFFLEKKQYRKKNKLTTQSQGTANFHKTVPALNLMNNIARHQIRTREQNQIKRTLKERIYLLKYKKQSSNFNEKQLDGEKIKLREGEP